MKTDTIAAIATGMTDSGIGIVRISGKRAVEIGNELFISPSGNKILKKAESHRLYYGFFLNIDEVMAVVMRAPKSFTGEDTVEIQCHGGVLVMQKILEAVLRAGARLAEPGEFTKRAFLNGRMDLSMAEAVIDVIHSQNEYALESSFNQLKGMLSEKVRTLRAEIIHEIAFIESALDDPEHISLDGYTDKLAKKVNDFLKSIEKLLNTADNGKLIKEGINTVLIGKPNAGKSSLLNLIMGEERAIVTDVAGTTRDILQETVRLGEINLNIMDTAGIRDTDDTVEKIGVEKAIKYAEKADLILYVADTSVNLDENDREIISFISSHHKNVIVFLNKSDLPNVVKEEEIRQIFEELIMRESETEQEQIDKSSCECKIEQNNVEKDRIEKGIVEENVKKDRVEGIIEQNNEEKKEVEKEIAEEDRIKENGKSSKIIMIRSSAKNNSGLEELEKTIKDIFFQGEIKSSNEVVITNIRHKEALQEAYDSLRLVNKSIQDGMPEDFYSIDLMSAYSSLGRIIGEEVDDDLVEEIFSKFCMGK